MGEVRVFGELNDLVRLDVLYVMVENRGDLVYFDVDAVEVISNALELDLDTDQTGARRAPFYPVTSE